jgi:hypothetical protein
MNTAASPSLLGGLGGLVASPFRALGGLFSKQVLLNMTTKHNTQVLHDADVAHLDAGPGNDARPKQQSPAARYAPH